MRKLREVVRDLRRAVGEGVALVPPEIIKQANPWLWPPRPEQSNQIVPDYAKKIKYTGTAYPGQPATGYGIESDPLSSKQSQWLRGKRGSMGLNESLKEVFDNLEIVREIIDAITDSDQTPESLVPELETALKSLELATEQTQTAQAGIAAAVGKTEGIAENRHKLAFRSKLRGAGIFRKKLNNLGAKNVTWNTAGPNDPGSIEFNLPDDKMTDLGLLATEYDAEVLGEGWKQRKGVLSETQEIAQQYKALTDKAAELDIDLPTALRQHHIDWPKDEDDLTKRAGHWFPVLRRALPKAWEIVKKLSQELAWQRGEKLAEGIGERVKYVGSYQGHDDKDFKTQTLTGKVIKDLGDNVLVRMDQKKADFGDQHWNSVKKLAGNAVSDADKGYVDEFTKDQLHPMTESLGMLVRHLKHMVKEMAWQREGKQLAEANTEENPCSEMLANNVYLEVVEPRHVVGFELYSGRDKKEGGRSVGSAELRGIGGAHRSTREEAAILAREAAKKTKEHLTFEPVRVKGTVEHNPKRDEWQPVVIVTGSCEPETGVREGLTGQRVQELKRMFIDW